VGPRQLFDLAWAGWALTWLVAALWSERTEKQVTGWEVWAYRLGAGVGLVMLTHAFAHALGMRRIWHVGYTGAYVLVGFVFAGILFAWWARIHLGPLWSGAITKKEGHHVIDTGPYAIVRHPIYTGLIGATVATALAEGTLTAVLGTILLISALWLKARTEERFLSEELDRGAYAEYQRRVPMLVPFV